MQPGEPNPDDPGAPDDDLGAIVRARRNARFVADMVGVHPKLFLIAMGGATVFALLTVASSFAIGRVIDDVILPSFEGGGVSTATVLAGLGLVIGIGLVRAAAIVVRRGYASVTMWRVAQTLTNRVVRRYVVQPMSWHNRRPDGDVNYSAAFHRLGGTMVLSTVMRCPVDLRSFWDSMTKITVSVGYGTSAYQPPALMSGIC